jgi:REP element-mobilizing transposase RayT
MARLLRSLLPDGAFHVTSRAVPELMLFVDPHDRRRFLALLRAVAARHGWRVHAYCLMGTHYHLVVECSRAQLSAGMKQLNGVYAQRYNAHHGRWGHVFGDRFASRVIEGDGYLAAAAAYVLDNPLRAGLVTRSRDWPWSWTCYDERTFERIDYAYDVRGSPRGARGARAQPQGHHGSPPAERARLHHGLVRLGQVEPRVRHDLRRGPAPVRRVALGVRAPVPADDGEA